MSDKKISQLTASTTPLAGTEVLPIVQSGETKKVAVSDLTAGRAVAVLSFASTNDSTVNGLTVGKGASNTTTNTAIGISALSSNTTGINNTAIGYQAGKNTTTSSTVGVTFVGSQAGAANTTGYNDGFGVGALQAVVTGNSNAAFGYGALNKATGSANSAFGFAALNSVVSAAGNTAFGASALQANTGANNTAIGYRAGVLLTTGANNTLIGGYEGTAGLVGHVIISDGAGNQRISIDASGNTTIPAGNIVIGTAGKGIDFSATPGTGTSELLADYEEGTWSPGVNFGGNNVDMVVTTTGTYTKVGRLVTVRCSVTFSAKGSSTGTFQITGLPFTVATKGAGTCGYNFAITVNSKTMFSFTAQGTVIVMYPLGLGDAANDTYFANGTDIQDITITYTA
jgi:hypothetical protein